MKNISLIDETFDTNITSTYQLSVQVGEQSFSFAIMDTIRMRYIALKNFWFETPVALENRASHLREIIQNEGHLARNYKSIHIMVETPGALLMPVSLYNPELLESYFEFSGPGLPNLSTQAQLIKSIDSYILFRVPGDLVQTFDAFFGEYRLLHQAQPQIEDAVQDQRNKSIPSLVYANISPGMVDLMVLHSGLLTFYNSFAIRTREDLIYFILYLFEQFSLSQEDTPLILSGFVELYDEGADLLDRYIRNIAKIELNKSYSYSPSFNSLIQHQFAHLINLARCE